jgi:hypothetical protein
MSAKPLTHTDLLGQELSEGSVVAAVRHSGYGAYMCICRVIKITPKKVVLEDVKQEYKEWLAYPAGTVKLSSEEAMMYILKHA